MDRFESAEVEQLWNEEDDAFSNEQFSILVMEQYKIYVEMADRAGFRRILINLFFLIINILVVSMLALGISRTGAPVSMFLMLLPLAGMTAICYSWWRVVRYYRHVVTIKEKVIGELERRLPCSPIWHAERKIASSKGALSPLKRMEGWMPFVFIGLYVAIYMYLLFVQPWYN
ncbi:hypothetical protein OAO18_01235 [Francisellaceae bacterium]|jgi:hypothetical protein|nr:hypothetical protein [Francisellaceae bacterium]